MVTTRAGAELSRAEQAERTRTQIIETAQRLFTARGYESTTLQLIADEMGLTKAAVYYYFRTKSEILRASLEPAIATVTALLDETATIRSRRQRMEHMATGWVEFLVTNRTIAIMGLNDPDLVAGRVRDRKARPKGRKRVEVLYGDSPTADERMAYVLFFAMAETLAEFEDLTDDELRETLFRTALRILNVR